MGYIMYVVELRIPRSRIMEVIENFENYIDLIEGSPLLTLGYVVRLKFYKGLKEVLEILRKHNLEDCIIRIYGY